MNHGLGIKEVELGVGRSRRILQGHWGHLLQCLLSLIQRCRYSEFRNDNDNHRSRVETLVLSFSLVLAHNTGGTGLEGQGQERKCVRARFCATSLSLQGERDPAGACNGDRERLNLNRA